MKNDHHLHFTLLLAFMKLSGIYHVTKFLYNFALFCFYFGCTFSSLIFIFVLFSKYNKLLLKFRYHPWPEHGGPVLLWLLGYIVM